MGGGGRRGQGGDGVRREWTARAVRTFSSRWSRFFFSLRRESRPVLPVWSQARMLYFHGVIKAGKLSAMGPTRGYNEYRADVSIE